MTTGNGEAITIQGRNSIFWQFTRFSKNNKWKSVNQLQLFIMSGFCWRAAAILSMWFSGSWTDISDKANTDLFLPSMRSLLWLFLCHLCLLSHWSSTENNQEMLYWLYSTIFKPEELYPKILKDKIVKNMVYNLLTSWTAAHMLVPSTSMRPLHGGR